MIDFFWPFRHYLNCFSCVDWVWFLSYIFACLACTADCFFSTVLVILQYLVQILYLFRLLLFQSDWTRDPTQIFVSFQPDINFSLNDSKFTIMYVIQRPTFSFLFRLCSCSDYMLCFARQESFRYTIFGKNNIFSDFLLRSWKQDTFDHLKRHFSVCPLHFFDHRYAHNTCCHVYVP